MKAGKAKRILSALGIAAALLLICFNILTVAFTATELRQRLNWLPYTFLTVESGSMEPEISAGDLVLIGETDFEQLQIGDDVTYIGVDELITHRIIGVENGGYITRGIANNTEDAGLMDRDEYCGRVLAVIPGMGGVLNVLTSKAVLLGLSAAVILACFARPAARALLKRRREQDASAPMRSLGRRSLACVCLVSALMCVPAMTAAKYTTRLEHSEMAVAGAMYFSSNYLSQEGNGYSIQGWDGKPYELSLEIKNSDNDLLFNADGMNVQYSIAVDISGADEGYSEDYTITVTPATNVKTSTAISGDGQHDVVSGYHELSGGEKLTHSFKILITPTNGEALEKGKKIHFTVTASTGKGQNFQRTLLGSFRMQVAENLNFIGQTTVSDRGSMVGLSVTTNLVGQGSDDHIVMFKWDTSKLFLNEYERTAFSVINKAGYYYPQDGRLYMILSAHAKIDLEFFKKADFDAEAESVFQVAVVDSLGALPEAAQLIQEP